VYQRPETGYAARSIASIRVIRGAGGKLAFLRALAFPRRDYVQGRYRGFAHRWWRGARDVAPRKRPEG
jgi:hypothetical protein